MMATAMRKRGMPTPRPMATPWPPPPLFLLGAVVGVVVAEEDVVVEAEVAVEEAEVAVLV
jgi:hypothetical protein